MQEQQVVTTFFSPKKLRKKQYLLQEGDVCRYMAFVEKGLCDLIMLMTKAWSI